MDAFGPSGRTRVGFEWPDPFPIHRAGIHRILLPARNEEDLEEIPEDVRKEIEVVPLTRIHEVVDAALEKFIANPPPPLPPVTDSSRAPEPEPQPLMAKQR